MAAEDPRQERVSDAVARWHAAPEGECEGPLNEHLGWTWEEYAAYVETSELPPEREGAA